MEVGLHGVVVALLVHLILPQSNTCTRNGEGFLKSAVIILLLDTSPNLKKRTSLESPHRKENKKIPSERASQGEENGASLSFIAPSREEL